MSLCPSGYLTVCLVLTWTSVMFLTGAAGGGELCHLGLGKTIKGQQKYIH